MNLTKKFKFSEKKPILIAEISANHSGNKKKFFRLINSAFESGADMVKIQTYEPKDITINDKTNPSLGLMDPSKSYRNSTRENKY